MIDELLYQLIVVVIKRFFSKTRVSQVYIRSSPNQITQVISAVWKADVLRDKVLELYVVRQEGNVIVILDWLFLDFSLGYQVKNILIKLRTMNFQCTLFFKKLICLCFSESETNK